MTLLVVANRFFEFDEVSGMVESTTSGHFDSSYVSNGMTPQMSSGADPNAYVTLDTPGASSDYWLHFRVYPTNVGSSDTSSSQAWLQLYNSSGTLVCDLVKESNVAHTSKLRVYGTSTITSVGTIGFTVNTAAFVDVHVSVSGATTVVNAYKDGVLACTATNTANGSRGIPQKAFARAANVGYNLFNRMQFSEFIVATTSTLNMRLDEMQVDVAGNYSDMVGTVTDLNTENPLTGLLTDAASERSSWEPVAYAGSGGIAAVVASGRAHRKSGVPSKLAHFLRMASVDYDGTDQTIDGCTAWQEIWETNPDTAVAWVGGDLSGIQVGLKSAT